MNRTLRRGIRWPIWLLVLTAVLELLVLVTSNRVVDSIFGLPLLLVVPGLALLALFIRPPSALPVGEWLMWTVVASIGISVLGGLLLNLLGGLTRLSWLLFVAVFVCVCSVAALLVGESSGENDAARNRPDDAEGQASATKSTSGVLLRPRSVVTLVVALALVVAALTLSQLSTSATGEHFAQLWLVPISEGGSNHADSAQLGIRNYEGRAASFLVSLYRSGSSKPASTWSIVLPNGARWSIDTGRPTGVGLRVTLRLRPLGGTPVQFVTLAASAGSVAG